MDWFFYNFEKYFTTTIMQNYSDKGKYVVMKIKNQTKEKRKKKNKKNITFWNNNLDSNMLFIYGIQYMKYIREKQNQ